MRVLTRREHKSFDTAFNFIDRVCMLGHLTDNTFEIRVLHNKETDVLPYKVTAFIAELGGLKAGAKFFNGHAKAETLPRFIKKLMDKHEQPREYFAQGTLIVDIISVQIMEYKN